MQGPLQRHPGCQERPDHADELGELAENLRLPPAPASSEDPQREDISNPSEQRDDGQRAGKERPQQPTERHPCDGGHQPDRSQLQAIELLTIDASLNQEIGIEPCRLQV